MKKNTFTAIGLFLAIMFLAANTQGQSSSSYDNSKFSIGIKGGLFYPAKSRVREMYDIYMISPGINLEINYSENLHILLEGMFTRTKNELVSKAYLDIIRVDIGAKYYFDNESLGNSIDNIRLFCGGGIGYYLGRSWGDAIFNWVPKEYSYYYKGYGGRIFAGFEFMLSNTSSLETELNYNFTYLEDYKKGGLGNMGGLYLCETFKIKF